MSKTTSQEFFSEFYKASELFFERKFSDAKESFKLLTEKYIDSVYSSYSLNWYMLSAEQLGENIKEEDYLNMIKNNVYVNIETQFCAIKWLLKSELRYGTKEKANILINETEVGSVYDWEISLEMACGLFEYKKDKEGAEEVLNRIVQTFKDADRIETVKFIRNYMNSEIPFGKYTANNNSLKEENITPDKYVLLGNYPNPFNPSTTISYSLPYQSSIELIIYDLMGRVVKSFNIASQPVGYQNIFWDGLNENGYTVSSGIYLYRINIQSLDNNETFAKTAKLIMLK